MSSKPNMSLPVFRWDRVWPGTPRLSGDHGLAWSHHVLQFLCHQDLNAADIRYIVQRTCALADAPWNHHGD